MTLRVLGLDPSLTATGWAVIDYDDRTFRLVESGVIRTTAAQGEGERLATIATAVKALCQRLAPTATGMEATFSGRYPQAAMALGMVRGVLLLQLWLAKQHVDATLSPTEVKKAVSLTGAANKARMQAATQAILGLDRPLPTDAADAAAVAICRAMRYRRTYTTL